MRISTTIEGLAGRGFHGGTGFARVRLGEVDARLDARLGARLGARVRGLGRVAKDIVSKVAVEVFGQLRARLEAAQGATGRRKRMRVVESLSLGGRRQLLLVRCDEQEYLVGTGPDSVETIVLRQPAVAAPAGIAEPGTGKAASAQPVSSQAFSPQSATGKGACAMRARLGFRERPEHGPWLVTAPGRGAALKDQGGALINRIQEAESGQGRESWQ